MTTPIDGLVISGGQSNSAAAGGLISDAPSDHYRHGSLIQMYNAAGSIVPTVESLNLNIDPYITANPTYGLSHMQFAANDYVDAWPTARLLHVPNAYSGSSLDTNWAIPSGPQTTAMISRINAAVAATRCRNAVLLWYQGEALEADPTTWAPKTQALWNYIQTQIGFAFRLIIYVRITATVPGLYAGYEAQWAATRVSQATLQTPTQIMVDPPDPAAVEGLHLSGAQQGTLGHTMGSILVAKWVFQSTASGRVTSAPASRGTSTSKPASRGTAMSLPASRGKGASSPASRGKPTSSPSSHH